MGGRVVAVGVDERSERVVLRTSRLLLREWREQDRRSFAAMSQDPRVMRHMPGLMDQAASDAFATRLDRFHATLGYTMWVVEVLDSERGSTSFAGFTGLMPVSFDPPFTHAEPVVEVGWRLWPQWWGLGIASEAARACLAHGFERIGLPEIISLTVVANTPSRAVMERIGMRYDTEFDHPRAEPSDGWRRHVLYRMRPGDPRP
jgi:ribosomal-protein-alanine N-acetyltransferase